MSNYGILRIHMGFTNFNYTLTSLKGNIIHTVNGGIGDPSKRTRMTTRNTTELMSSFLISCKRDTEIQFIKVLFTGPSKRFRGKLISIIKKKAPRMQWSIVCLEEGFRPGLQGHRLARRKR